MNVLGTRLDPDQHHRLTLGGAHLGFVGVEHRHAAGGTRAGRQPFAEQRAGRLRVQRRVQQLVERRWVNPADRLLLVDQAGLRHLDRNAQAGRRRALAAAGLQHVQRVLLHGELDVLHVGVMAFQRFPHPHQVGIGGGQRLFHADFAGVGTQLGQRLRRADAGHDVLALRVDEELTVEHVLARARVAREAHAGCAIGTHVAEHHRLHVDGGAPGGGDVMQAAVDVGARVHPAAKYGADGAPELFVRVHRERRATVRQHHRLVFGHHAAPIVRAQRRVVTDVGVELGALDDLLEPVMVHIQHDRAVHLDEPAIAVPGKPAVARGFLEPQHRFVVEPKVEHRIHHARHRHACTGADADQQGFVRVAKL